MRLYSASALIPLTLISGSVLQRAAFTDDSSPHLPAQPASTPTQEVPAATLSAELAVLEFRPEVQTLHIISKTLAAPTITTLPASSTTHELEWGIESEYTTTQWIETWINSTSRTWVPKTITLHFRSMSPAPRPGKGEIGMGTLASGDMGQTETIIGGAAPTQAVGWAIGVGVLVGVLGAVV